VALDESAAGSDSPTALATDAAIATVTEPTVDREASAT
jgi:hypothetical protein